MVKKRVCVTKILVLFSFTLILSVSIISAIGVANSYWDEKPLKLAPGESITISLRLQSEGDEQVAIEVSLESEIASLVDGTNYDVLPGGESTPVYIKVEIPEDAQIGTKYTVLSSFTQVSSEEGGGFFQVAPGVTSKVPVEVVGEQESEIFEKGEETKLNSSYLIALILIILILSFLYKRTKRK